VKICIDATPIGVKAMYKGGVLRYIRELIAALSSIDSSNKYVLFFNFFRREHLPSFSEAVKRFGIKENIHVRLSRCPMRLRNLLDPPMELLAGRFDLFHGCFDHLPPLLFGKGVVTIHDIRYIDCVEEAMDAEWLPVLERTVPEPEFSKKDYHARRFLFGYLRSTIEKSTARSRGIITVSEYSKRRLVTLLGIPEEKVRVIYNGVNDFFRPLPEKDISPVFAKFNIRKPYIFYTGNFDPLKNLLVLLEAFKEVRSNHDISLVMVGQVNWFYYILAEKARNLGIFDSVVFTNFVSDGELVALYNGASAFVFPSLYEGFGMPVLEAMACGTPVVCSSACSLPEVAGDATLLVDAASASTLARAIDTILSDERVQDELKEKGMKRAKLFTWENTAKQTLDFYREIAEKREIF
jgi:glycosyltransferase involved in cell wall biosynthesis